MAQAVQSVSEQMLKHADNASYADIGSFEAPTSAKFSLLQNPAIALGFGLILLLVLSKVFGGKKLPPGVKPLPSHPGMWKPRLYQLERR